MGICIFEKPVCKAGKEEPWKVYRTGILRNPGPERAWILYIKGKVRKKKVNFYLAYIENRMYNYSIFRKKYA